MCSRDSKILAELVSKDSNSVCADCGFANPEWASYNIGVFLCTTCASFHRKLGCHISKVKSLKLDKWSHDLVEMMRCNGNDAANKIYEQDVPPCYRKPKQGDPQVLIEQWIAAKYARKEFQGGGKQVYLKGYMEGTLMKKAKDESKYFPRKFILSEKDNQLKYYNKDNSREPKATVPLMELNVCLAPTKMNQENGMQLSYILEGSTRHIYVYHESGEVIINWYLAIRSAKLNRLLVAYPSASPSELVPYLTNDFMLEGWLWKTGPGERDSYRKRWFILDGRKLMYHEGIMDAFPKGEIFLGHKDDGYDMKNDIPSGCKSQDFPFSLVTPRRTYIMAAQSPDERDTWISAISSILERPMCPQDNQSKMALSNSKRRSRQSWF